MDIFIPMTMIGRILSMITTIEGVGYYPQAGFHFLAGMTIRF